MNALLEQALAKAKARASKVAASTGSKKKQPKGKDQVSSATETVQPGAW